MKTLHSLFLLLGVLWPGCAFAVCGPTPLLDGGGLSYNFASINNASSQCEFGHYLTDAAGNNAFPTVAALGDSISNPTTFLSGSLLAGWDATNSLWKRVQVDPATGTLKVDPGTVTLAANSSVNLTQVNGVAMSTGSGATGTGTQRVGQAIDTATIAGAAPGPAGTASPNVISVQGIAGMTPLLVSGGCAGATQANTFVKPINNVGSANNLLLVNKVASQNVYICAIDITVGAAVSVALVEGTQTTNPCDTATAGMAGGATAATGWPLLAGGGGGLTKGNGQGIVYKTATVNHDVCLFFSSATQASGAITWMQAP